MKQFFYLFLVVLLLASCGARRNPCNRVARILERHPQCQSNDTVFKTIIDTVPGETIEGSAPLDLSEEFLDSLKETLKDCPDGDSLAKTIYKQAAKNIRIEPVNDTTDRYTLNIWVKDGRMHYKNVVFPKIIERKVATSVSNLKPVIVTEKKIPRIVWLIIIGLILIIIFKK